MKTTIGLRVSLAINIVLFITLVLFVQRKPAPTQITIPQPAAEVAVVPETVPALSTAPVVATSGPAWLPWLGQLRAAGVPDSVIAGLVVSDFQNRWDNKMHDAWKKYQTGEIDDDERADIEAQRSEMQEKELVAALGREGFVQWDKTHVLEDVNANGMKLSATEADGLYQLRKDLERKNHELEESRRLGEIDPAEFGDQQSAAQAEYEKQFKALVGDERYAAQQNPEDGMEASLRRTLRTINVNASDAQNVEAVQSKWSADRLALDQQAQQGQLQGAAYEEKIQAADAARDEAYRQVLGTNGLAQLEQAQDTRYQTLKRYAGAWQLSDSDINYVYQTMQHRQTAVDDYQKQAQALEQQGQTVDWTKVQQSIQQFASQTDTALNNYLGSDRFAKLKRNGLLTASDH